jgi:hypothetical protein
MKPDARPTRLTAVQIGLLGAVLGFANSKVAAFSPGHVLTWIGLVLLIGGAALGVYSFRGSRPDIFLFWYVLAWFALLALTFAGAVTV